MKAYCYLDINATLNLRTKDYIDTENPGFWRDNGAFILKAWQFDTEDMSSMYRLFTDFKNLELKTEPVKEFAKAINFDINNLREYASSLQSNKG